MEHGWLQERRLFQCWENIERRFYDEWAHGILWMIAGLVGLAATWVGAREWGVVTVRLMLAALVLGIGIGILRLLGWHQVVRVSPFAILSLLARKRCSAPFVRRYRFFLGLMESGFVLIECAVLFGLVMLSTTLATLPVNKGSVFSLVMTLWVYGFFALAFGSKSVTSAIGWGIWLRPHLEKRLGWQGAHWLLANGSWQLTRFNLLCPAPSSGKVHRPLTWVWRGLLLCLMLTLMIFGLTLAALTLNE